LRHWEAPGVVRTRVGGVGLQGALSSRILIDTGQKRAICGVEFEAGGSTAFYDLPATGFFDTIVDARDAWGEEAAAFRAELLTLSEAEHILDSVETFLLQRLRSRGFEDDHLGPVGIHNLGEL
jgi:hypothetical protein